MHKPDRDECTTSSSQWPLVQPKPESPTLETCRDPKCSMSKSVELRAAHTPQSVHGVKIAFLGEQRKGGQVVPLSAPKTRRKAEDAQQSQQHDAVDQVMRVLIACVPGPPFIRPPTRCAVGAVMSRRRHVFGSRNAQRMMWSRENKGGKHMTRNVGFGHLL